MPTHGPLALTTPLAATGKRVPVVLSSSVASQREPRRASLTHSVRVRTSAPRKCASRAFSTTRRASCTQQSEYSNARR